MILNPHLESFVNFLQGKALIQLLREATLAKKKQQEEMGLFAESNDPFSFPRDPSKQNLVTLATRGLP